MPEAKKDDKTSARVKHPRGSVAGKDFNWEREDGGTLTIPLRVKMKTMLELNDIELDAKGMFQFISAIAPDQVPVIEDMDLNDFTLAFNEWNATYSEATGATLGESEGSSA